MYSIYCSAPRKYLLLLRVLMEMNTNPVDSFLPELYTDASYMRAYQGRCKYCSVVVSKLQHFPLYLGTVV